MKAVLNKLIEHQRLTRIEAKDILSDLAQGKFNRSEVAAFLTVYLMRSISVEELGGFRDAMLELCIPVNVDDYDAIDLCGTGGDGKNTFNISTLASFVVAGAGQNVAKHGNKSVSSVSGSSDVLAYFGYKFTNDINQLKRDMDNAGICFLHAPLFHPAMKNVGPIRQELGIKTFFNMLGPMVNPAFPKKQLVGVFNLELARLYGYLYQETDKHFVILHALDGYDEISLTGDFKMITNHGESVLSPSDLGLSQIQPEALFSGDSVESSAKIFMNVLKGNGTKEQNEAVMANAGLAIYTGKQLATPREGVEMARESLESGKALEKFKLLVNE